jgi:hypothetical protein
MMCRHIVDRPIISRYALRHWFFGLKVEDKHQPEVAALLEVIGTALPIETHIYHKEIDNLVYVTNIGNKNVQKIIIKKAGLVEAYIGSWHVYIGIHRLCFFWRYDTKQRKLAQSFRKKKTLSFKKEVTSENKVSNKDNSEDIMHIC